MVHGPEKQKDGNRHRSAILGRLAAKRFKERGLFLPPPPPPAAPWPHGRMAAEQSESPGAPSRARSTTYRFRNQSRRKQLKRGGPSQPRQQYHLTLKKRLHPGLGAKPRRQACRQVITAAKLKSTTITATNLNLAMTQPVRSQRSHPQICRFRRSPPQSSRPCHQAWHRTRKPDLRS